MNDETLLLRQVHPSWAQNGRISSQVFRPTPKDGKRLSVYDGDQVTPEQAWRHFTEELELRSIGVVAVTVEECAARELPVIPDPRPFKAHVLIDFAGLSDNAIRKKAKYLKTAAEARGWRYLTEH